MILSLFHIVLTQNYFAFFCVFICYGEDYMPQAGCGGGNSIGSVARVRAERDL